MHPLLEHDGYVYVTEYTQALHSSCRADARAYVRVPCTEMQWEEESIERLRDLIEYGNWIKF